MIVEHPYFHLIPSLSNEIDVHVKICLSAADLVLAQFYFAYLLHYSTKKAYTIYAPVKLINISQSHFLFATSR